MNQPSVLKFGGSSVGTAESIGHATRLIQQAQQAGPTAVVVSAARPPGTNGTTNRLIELAGLAHAGEQWRDQLDDLLHIHATLIANLGLAATNLDDPAEELERHLRAIPTRGSEGDEISQQNLDTAKAWGERTMHSTIFQPALQQAGVQSQAVDAAELIRMNPMTGEPNFRQTYEMTGEKLNPIINNGTVAVVPGFYGEDEEGNLVALPRGGSDYTGSLVARGVDARQLDICTDMKGVLQVDPRKLAGTRYIPQLSYYEMGALARSGTSIVFPSAVKPLIRNGKPGIPMRIVDTASGESMTRVTSDQNIGLKAISATKGETFLRIADLSMGNRHGVASEITQALAEARLNINFSTTERHAIGLTVEGNIPAELNTELRDKFDEVDIHTGQSVVTAVGHGINGEIQAPVELLELTRNIRTGKGGLDVELSVVIPDEYSDNTVRDFYDRVLKVN